MNKRTFLVTGGAGFIGSALCSHLIEQGNKVINIDNFNDFYDPEIKEQNIAPLIHNSNYILYRADITDRDIFSNIFEQHKVDVVVHLAAMAGVRPSIEQPVLYEQVNVQGTLNLLEAMKKHDLRHLIFASSSSVYGNNSKIPFQENEPLDRVISPYAASKKSAEDFCYVYHELFGLNVVALRFFTVYGPGQRPDLAIHKFTRKIFSGEPIPFFGDGNTVRDYAYIDDIIHGILSSVDFILNNTNVFEVFNLSGHHPVSLKEMVSVIEQTIGKKANIKQLPMQPGDVKATHADISKARHLLGFKPETGFSTGIKHFVEWYKTTILNNELP